MMKKLISLLFRERLYYTILFTITILFIILSLIFKIDKSFSIFYEINYSQINNSFSTFFGILFTFIFAIMSIIFSMGKDSLFLELIEKNNRAKKDVINYFIWALIPLALVTILSLFLTITSIDISNNQQIISSFPYILSLNGFLAYSLFYLSVFSLINVTCLTIVFILILRS